MTIEQAIDIISRVDICSNAAETARDMAIEALRDNQRLRDMWAKAVAELSKANANAKLPAVDAVEVVRCKDCKHKITTVFSTKYGRFAVCEICKGIRHGLDDFCSYGERREENAAD